MYTIIRTKGFEKSFRRLTRGGLTKRNKDSITEVIHMLASGKVLDKKYKDHQLKGEYKDYRECHVLNDLLLMYKIENDELILVLANIGSHSQLFG